MNADTTRDHNKETLLAANQCHNNVNTLQGNKVLNSTETHCLMAHSQLTWINLEGDSVLDNPVKIVHTMMNWYHVSVTTNEVTNIPHIWELDQTPPLVTSVWEFSTEKNITLTPSTKSFAQLLSYKNTDVNLILIVAETTKNSQEANDTKTPYYPQITVLMLLIQDEPHFILPAS